MKVLSLLQPWASLVVLGYKKIETRSWDTKYRGEVLIHASKNEKFVKTTEQSCDGDLIEELEKLNMLTQADYPYPYGAIIGKVNIRTSMLMVNFPADARSGKIDGIYFNQWGARLTDRELSFGDYRDGRYGWLLSDSLAFNEPISCKGNLSIWNLPVELEEAVNKQVEISRLQIF